VSLPGLPSAGSSVVVAMTLSKTTGLLASSGETTSFSVLHNSLATTIHIRRSHR